MPPLKREGLRDCQIDAIENLEWSQKEARPRTLIQMASGSGKTFTAVTEAYRLIKFGGAKRILFLEDRNNLGKQTLREFQNYAISDDGRKFTLSPRANDFFKLLDSGGVSFQSYR
jgi:type I restriction enzyme, R subunit